MEFSLIVGLIPLFAARPLVAFVVATMCLELVSLVATVRSGSSVAAVGSVLLLFLFKLVLGAVLTGALEGALRWLQAKAEAIWSEVTAVGRLLWQAVSTAMFLWFVLEHLESAVATRPTGAADVAVAGFELRSVGVVGCALVLWTMVGVRARLAAVLSSVPLLDTKPVRQAAALSEIGLVTFAVVAVFLVPWLGYLVFIVGLATLVAGWLAMRMFEQRQLAPCAACQTRVHRSASKCFQCNAQRTPSRLGPFGTASSRAVEDASRHRTAMLAALRCPACAEPMTMRDGRPTCGACREAFSGADAVALAKYADVKLLALTPFLVVAGLVPWLGLGVGLLSYRLSPASAAGRYTRFSDRLLSRLLRIAGLLVLTVLQPVPLLGALVVPAFVGSLHAPARRSLLRQAEA